MGKSAIGRNLLRADAVVDYTALNDASTTSTQTLFNLPAGAIVIDSFFDVVTPLNAASGITSVTLKIGVSGSTAAFCDATSAFAGTATAGSRYADKTNPSTKRVFSAGADVLGTFVADSAFGDGSTSNLNAGVVRCSVLYYQLPIAGA